MPRQKIQFGLDVGPELWKKLDVIMGERDRVTASVVELLQNLHPELSVIVKKKSSAGDVVLGLINQEYAKIIALQEKYGVSEGAFTGPLGTS